MPHWAQATCLAALAGCLLTIGCGGGGRRAAPDDPDDQPELPLAEDGSIDVSGGPWRLIEVPTAAPEPVVIRTEDGWLALSTRLLGSGKVVLGHQSALYRSRDGVAWDLVPLEPGHEDLALHGIAHGSGRFVMVGQRFGTEGAVVWRSDDAEHWIETRVAVDSIQIFNRVIFTGGRFFALGFHLLGVSEDGEDFTLVEVETTQPQDVAHGNGRFLLVGNGPMEVSEDGLRWQAHALDCALPGACITDPSGGIHQSIQSHALFAEGRFFSDQLSSSDGVSWEARPGEFPMVFAHGHFLGYAQDGSLQAWRLDAPMQALETVRHTPASVTEAGRDPSQVGVLDREAPFPERVEVPFEDGLTCEDASCVILGGRLYLVPPPGTAPLPDRVPRIAGGAPLLTDACPVSGMTTCDDYEARSGCVCLPGAPRGPESCDDVSRYQCEGAFVPRDDEWQVAELDRGGCTCSAVDPNQPPTFGDPCNPDPQQSHCEAPLQCLAVEPEASFGGPPPAPPTICTAPCSGDADCPTWEATGFCAGTVSLRCASGSCQPRTCGG